MGFFNSNLNIEVKISDKNTKMGMVPSVSLPPVISCHNCKECVKKCYARRMYQRLSNVREQYDFNWALWNENPDKYFEDISQVMSCTDKFRFHVSGDIPNMDYLERLVAVCRENKKCQVLCFTKNYQDVNNWLTIHKRLPKNLHLIFSVWDNTPYENPFNLPTAHVLYRDGHTTAKNPTHLCDGNCFKCFINDQGCIGLKKGESVVFKQH